MTRNRLQPRARVSTVRTGVSLFESTPVEAFILAAIFSEVVVLAALLPRASLILNHKLLYRSLQVGLQSSPGI